MTRIDKIRISLCIIVAGMVLTGNPVFAQKKAASTNLEIDKKQRVESIISQMTIEEKLGQLTQHRWVWGDQNEAKREELRQKIRDGLVGSFLGVSGVEYSGNLQKIAVEESRLGVPLIFAQDVIHGWRTTFPIPLAEAATWDPQSAEKSARIAAIEATAVGTHWTFAPMVDIARDPRWGRIIEGSGEDPFLGSVMAAARIRGFQGSDLGDPQTLLACAKHFAAYGGAEAGRDYNTVDISERTLREIYLPPFHAAVDAGVGSFMGAFNEISGVPMHANHYLINEVLRKKWGFDGIFISDFTAVMELMRHGVAENSAAAGMLALRSGVDIDMVSGIYSDDLPEKVRSGTLDETVVDAAVRRVLDAKFDLGLLDDPFRYHDLQREKTLLVTPEHLAAARDVARKAIVLLKNENNLLPLSKSIGTIAVIGGLAEDSLSQLGAWHAIGKPGDATTILAGIRQAVSSQTKILYDSAYALPSFAAVDNFASAEQLATSADAVLLVIGETSNMSGEAKNRATINLPGDQLALAKKLYATGKPVVVLLVNGRPLAIPWLAEHIPAIIEGWQLGSQMGPAVADVLFGDVNPSGKLPVTFPRTTGQIPIYYNHKNSGRPPDSTDFYTSKYLDVHWTPQFPFGWGLSYTTFSYAEPQLSAEKMAPDGSIQVAVRVSNTGSCSGAEVVQLYLQDVVASVTRPVKQLRGFERVELQPGESRTVTFTVTPDDLAFYNQQMQRVVEPGEFRVFAGGNSVDVKSVSFWVE